MDSYSYAACTRTYEPLWQQGLRQCVRLYLALDEPDREVRTLEPALRRLEYRLCRYLQLGRPLTPETSAEARGLLEAAQVQWLGDEARCTQLRRELSVTQALRPMPILLQPIPARPDWQRRSRPAGAMRTSAWGR